MQAWWSPYATPGRKAINPHDIKYEIWLVTLGVLSKGFLALLDFISELTGESLTV